MPKGDYIVIAINKKTQTKNELVENLIAQWKTLWREKIDDPIKAEKIANNTYSSLYIEKGTIIQASRNYKIPSFKEIVRLNKIENGERYIPPNPNIGGWTKFTKKYITSQKTNKKNPNPLIQKNRDKKNLQKQSGRGWIHK